MQACLLLPLAGVFANSAQAQTTLVSNLTTGTDALTQSTRARAQRFTAGSSSTLSSVEIEYEDTQGDAFDASVCTVDASGFPTSTCTALTSPDSFAAGTLVFTAPPNTTLSANTTYTVKMVPTGSATVSWTGTANDGEDSGGQSGWSIENEYEFLNSSSVWGTTSSGNSHRIAIKGTVGTTTDTTAPTVSSAAVNGASLVITFDESLAAAASLANSAFTVKKTPSGGGEQTESLSGSPSISGATVTLTLATAVVATDGDIKVSYTKPTTGSNNTLEDDDGNEVASFTNQAVDNNTSVTNSAPVFTNGAQTTRSFNESIGDATVTTAAAIGSAVAATDADTGDTLAYSMADTTSGSGDAAKFTINSGTGQISTKVGENYSRETKASYAVTLTVTDGTDSDTIAVTLNVNDQNEPPVKPATPTVDEVESATAIKVRWVLPNNTDRPPISANFIRHRKNGSGGWNTTNFTPGSVWFDFQNLDVAVEYEFQYKAENNEGEGPWSDSLVASTASKAKPVTPAAPTVTATSGSTTGLDVSWTAPGIPTGEVARPAISSYNLRYRAGNSGGYTTDPLDYTGTSASITGLTANTSYEVQVRGTNTNGNSPWSDAGTGSTGTTTSTDVVLVSTLSQGADGSTDLGGTAGTMVAQRFTVGENRDATLTDVTIHTTAGSDITVAIHAEDGSNPADTALHPLTTPATTTAGNRTFAAPGDITLEKGKSYFVVVSGPATGTTRSVSVTDSDMLDAASLAEWAVDDTSRFSSSGFWFADTSSYALLMRLQGAEIIDVTDATLKALELENPADSSAIELNETFASTTTDYTADVVNAVDRITVKPTVNEINATVAYFDADDMALADADTDTTGQQVDLAVGETTIKVKVTADDDTTNETYSVVVNRVAAQGACPADNDWCATLTVELTRVGRTSQDGYAEADFGQLDSATVDYFDPAETVQHVFIETQRDLGDNVTSRNVIVRLDDYAPLGTVFSLGGEEFIANAASRVTTLQGSHSWTAPDALTWIDGHKVTVAANFAPGRPQATVDGDSLVLTYFEDLDTGSSPAASAYSVEVDSDGGTAPSSVSVSGATVTLTLATAVTGSQVVTVSYTAPSTNPLRDESELNAPDLTDWPVTNSTLVCDAAGTVWCAALTVQDLGSNHLGCANNSSGNECSNAAHLTEDEFTHDMTDYAVTSVQDRSNGQLQLWLNPNLTTATQSLSLFVDDVEFAFEDADVKEASNRRWNNAGLGWLNSQVVNLSLRRDPSTLSDLTLKNGAGEAVSLSPEFAPATTAYTASVLNRNQRVTFEATENVSGATVAYLDGDDAALTDADTGKDGFQVGTEEGANTVKVKVTAEDGATNTYTVVVTREAAATGHEAWTDLLTNGEATTVRGGYCGSAAIDTVPCANGTFGMLDDPEFTLDGRDYVVEGLSWLFDSGSGLNLYLTLDRDLPPSRISNTWVLVRGTPADFTFPLSEATRGTGDNTYQWFAGPEEFLDIGNTTAVKLLIPTLLSEFGNDATLRGMDLSDPDDGSAIGLNETFASGTTTYTVEVPRVVDQITILPSLGDNRATFTWLDGDNAALADADSAEDDFQFDLDEGDNTVKVKVTAKDGVTNQNYTLVITRGNACDSARTVWCATLTVQPLGSTHRGCANSVSGKHCSNTAHLSEDEFTHDMTNYAVTSVQDRSNGQLQLWLNPNLTTATQSLVLLVDDQEFAFEDADTKEANNRFWNNAGLGWLNNQVVTLVLQPGSSSDATLSGLALSYDDDGTETDIELNENFVSTTTDYTADVANTINEITVTPTTSQDDATVEYLDGSDAALTDADTDADGFQAELAVGENTIKVKVTAKDTTTAETYTLVVTRLLTPPVLALVSNLEQTRDSFDAETVVLHTVVAQQFTTGSSSYVLTAAHIDVDSVASGSSPDLNVRICPKGSGDFPDTDDCLATLSDPASLGAGVQEFRAHGAGVALAGGTPYYLVASNTETVGVILNVTDSTAEDSGAAAGWSIANAGRKSTNGGSTYGATTDGAVLKIAIQGYDTTSDPVSSDATLSDIELSYDDDGTETAIDLFPAFDPTRTTGYNVSVSNPVAQITFTPTANHDAATIEYLDAANAALADANSIADGFQIELDETLNIFKAKVTAEDGDTVQTYTLIVSRPLSDLPVLVSSLGESTSAGYTVGGATDNSLAQKFTVGPDAEYTLEQVRINLDDSGEGVAISIHEPASGDADNPADTSLYDLETPLRTTLGVRTFTAASGATLTLTRGESYFVVVSGPASGLTLSVTSSDSETGVMDWEIEDDSRTRSGVNAWQSNSNAAKVQLRGNPVPSTASDATLSNLELENPADSSAIYLNEAFVSATTDYTADVANAIDEITVAPTTSQVDATVEYLDGSDTALTDADDMEDGFQVELEEGDNTIKLKVTAENTTTTRTYTLVVRRSSSSLVWNTTLTIGSSSAGDRGFSASASNLYGSVENDTFEQPSGTDRVVQTLFASNTGVFFRTDGGGSTFTGLVLELAGETLPLDDATRANSTFSWGQTWLDSNAPALNATNYAATLPEHGTGTVCLRTATQSCPLTAIRSPAVVTIEADNDSVLLRSSRDDDADGVLDGTTSWTLTRTGSTVSALTVQVTITQDPTLLPTSKLAHDVTFAAGAATTTLVLTPTEFMPFPDGETVANGTLTATLSDGEGYLVGTDDSAEVTMVVTIMVGFEATTYQVGEEAGPLTITLVARTGANAPLPFGIFASVSTEPLDVAEAAVQEDYVAVSSNVQFSSTDYVVDGTAWKAEKTLELTIENDSEAESNERFYAALEKSPGLDTSVIFINPDRTLCPGTGNPPTLKCRTEITIVDDGDSNTPAAGSPTISGTAQVGKKLTADASGITDSEGRTMADAGDALHAFVYQWLRVDSTNVETEIDGATAMTYRLTRSDEGHTVKVRVRFRDDSRNHEERTSASWPTSGSVLAEPPCDGVWCAVLTVRDLSSGRGGCRNNSVGNECTDIDNLTEDEFHYDSTDYAIIRLQLTSSAQLQFSLDTNFTTATEGLVLHVDDVAFNFADANGQGNDFRNWNESGLSWTVGDDVVLRLTDSNTTAATGNPGIEGTAAVHETLRATIGDITDPDGVPAFPDDFEFQWLRVDSADNETDIADATSRTYVPVAADVGNTLRVKVAFTDGDGTEEELTSDSTAVVTTNTDTTDATLRALTLEDGDGNGIMLSPGFVSTTTSYTASVVNVVNEVTLTPSVSQDDATVEYLDDSDAALTDADTNATGFQVELDVGTTTVKVKVTSGDGNSTETYTVAVTRLGAPPLSALVSNLDQTTNTSSTEGIGANTVLAQQFTTGSSSYVLTAAHVDVASVAPGFAELDVRICPKGSGDFPDTDDCLATLLDPSSLSVGTGVQEFTASGSGVALAGGTPYYLVASIPGTVVVSLNVTSSDAEDSGAAAGWSIANAGRSSFDGGTTYEAIGLGVSLKIAIQGYDTTSDPASTVAGGQPGIDGAPQVDQTLKATIGDIADGDGLPTFPDDFTFQWVRVDADGTSNPMNVGTDSHEYPVTTADLGKKLKVQVTFTDDGGTSEGPLESDVTAAVVAKQEDCDTDRPDNDWCEEMTVGKNVGSGGLISWGFSSLGAGYGALSNATINYGDDTYTLSSVQLVSAATPYIAIESSAHVPRGSVFNLGGTEFTADADSEVSGGAYDWDAPSGFAWIEGQKVTVSANLAPVVTDATVNGDQLVLTFAEDLDTGSVPAPGFFPVNVDGTVAAPTSVDVSGKEVTLTLATAVTSAQTVTVSYTVPATNPLQDESGLAAVALLNETVTNNTGVIATDATLSGLELTWDDGGTETDIDLDPAFAPGTTSYTADDVANAVDEITVAPTLSDSNASVAYLDGDDMALTDADLNATGFQVELDVGETTVKVKVTAEDDNTTETYAVAVTRLETITVGYDPAAYEVSEDGASVTLTIKVSSHPGGAPRAFTLSTSTVDGTAESPADYGGDTNLLLHFNVGDVAQTHTIAIVEDTDLEVDENFSVTLSPFSGSDVTIAPATATVTIEDNDPPAQVTGVTTAPGNQQLSVIWTAADLATGYKVQWKSGSQDYNTGNRQAVIGSGATTSHTITGLTNATEYTVRVIGTRLLTSGTTVDGDASAEVTGTPESDDTTAPIFASAAVVGTGLVITFSENLAAAANLANSAFDVKKTPSGGSEQTESLSGSPTISGNTVTLTLASAAVHDDTDVKVLYTRPATGSNNKLKDAADNEVVTFTDHRPVTNNTQEINYPATGEPVISGPPQVGMTLTAGKGDIDDPNGLPTTTFPVGYEFRWLRGSTPISGATDFTYVPGTADVTETIKVRVTFEDGGGVEETRTSDATFAVMPAADTSTCQTGVDPWCATLTVGQFIDPDEGFPEEVGFDVGDGYGSLDTMAFTHRGIAYTVTLLAASAVNAYFATTPNLPADGAGLVLHLQNVQGERALPLSDAVLQGDRWFFDKGTLTSAFEGEPASDVSLLRTFAGGDSPLPADTDTGTEVAVRLSSDNNPATGAPGITGTAKAGRTLTATTAGIADADGKTRANNGDTGYAWSYQWYRVDADGTSNRTPIAGATAETYTLTDDDAGKKVIVEAHFTDDEGDPEGPLASNAFPSSGTVAGPDPTVRFGASSYAATEGRGGVQVTVLLEPAADRAVTIPLTVTRSGATSSDYSGVPSSLAFAAGQTSATFTVTAAADSVTESGESLRIAFGALPAGIVRGVPTTTRVTLLDDARVSVWYIFFDQPTYTATEGGAGARVTPRLSAPWKRNESLTVRLSAAQLRGGASDADFSGLPYSVTFPPGEKFAETFTVTATDDGVNDDGESIEFGYAAIRPFPANLKVGQGPGIVTVHLADNDGLREVTVSFDERAYEAVEGGADATVAVRLSEAPGRVVTVPLTRTHNGAGANDYSGVPSSVTFGANETSRTFVVSATDDNDDDDLESVTLGFGDLQSGVSPGSPATAAVNLTDNDGGKVRRTLTFGAHNSVIRSVREGIAYNLTLSLNKAANAAVRVPLQVQYTGGATADDVTGVPASLTIEARQRTANVIIRMVDDAQIDPGEGFKVTFGTLPAGVQADSRYSVATFRIVDNDRLPEVTVSDASAHEPPPGQDAWLKFRVRLSQSPLDKVLVHYATVDGTAKAGQDYEATSGTVRFAKGDREEYVWVKLIDDDHDEGTETMTLLLSDPVNATLRDNTAEGRINNTDKMPGAWLTRFGRAASDQALAAIGQRFDEKSRTSHLTLGGGGFNRLRSWGDGLWNEPRDDTAPDARFGELTSWERMDRLAGQSLADGTETGSAADGGAIEGGLAGGGSVGSGPESGGLLGAGPAGQRSEGGRGGTGLDGFARLLGVPDLRDLVMGSSFAYSPGADAKAATPDWLGSWSAWGETGASRFRGAEGAMNINGELTTATFGFDSRWNRWMGGLALSYSEGDGAYARRGAGGGEVNTTLASLNPYARYQINRRTSVWGVLGFGVGDLTLTPERADEALKTQLSHSMAAFGGRTALSVRTGRTGKFELALRSDARLTNTASDTVQGLMGAAGATSRVRVMLEGSGSLPLATGGVLRPTLEAGLRYDAGDAETGAGLEIGGGLGYSAGALKVQVNARGLLAHEDSEYEEWGFSGSVAYAPGKDGRGLNLKLGSAWGATQSGVQSLWSRETADGLVRGGTAMDGAQRFQGEFGYGLAGRKGRALWVPYLAAQAADAGRSTLRLGLKMSSGRNARAELELGQQANARGETAHAVCLGGSVRF